MSRLLVVAFIFLLMKLELSGTAQMSRPVIIFQAKASHSFVTNLINCSTSNHLDQGFSIRRLPGRREGAGTH